MTCEVPYSRLCPQDSWRGDPDVDRNAGRVRPGLTSSYCSFLFVAAADGVDIPASPISPGVHSVPTDTLHPKQSDNMLSFSVRPCGLLTVCVGLGDGGRFTATFLRLPVSASQGVKRRPEMSQSPACCWAPFLFMGFYHKSCSCKTFRSGH